MSAGEITAVAAIAALPEAVLMRMRPAPPPPPPTVIVLCFESLNPGAPFTEEPAEPLPLPAPPAAATPDALPACESPALELPRGRMPSYAFGGGHVLITKTGACMMGNVG